MSRDHQQFYSALAAIIVLLLTVFATAVFRSDTRIEKLTDRVHMLEKRVRDLESR